MKKRRIMVFFKRIFGNFSLGKSLGIQMFAVSLILAGLGCINLYTNWTIEKQSNEANLKVLSMTLDQMDEQLITVENQMAGYLTGRASELVEIRKETRNKEYLYAILDKEMKKSFAANSWVQAVFLYNGEGNRMVSYRKVEYALLDEVRAFNESMIADGNLSTRSWFVRQLGNQVHVVRAMKMRDYYLLVYLDGEAFFHALEEGENPPFDKLFFTNENREVMGVTGLSEEAAAQLTQFKDELIYNQLSESYTMIVSSSGRTGISIGGLRYKTFLQQNIGVLQVLLGLFLILAVFYVTGWSLFNRRTLVGPVSKLVKAMEEVESGNLRTTVEEEAYYQEFRALNYQFNRMVSEIEKLKIDIYEEQINRQNAELKFLQLQINPHFFLNALNILYTLALTKQTDKSKELVAHLMTHSRYILKARKEKIQIGEELRHIENFIQIQRIRYAYPIRFCIQTDSPQGEADYDSYRIPPMLLYTFVENSVKYSLTEEAAGVSIVISVGTEEAVGKKLLKLRIEDRGAGYSKEVLPLLNSGEAILDQRGEEHYGVANVIQRLEILYQGSAAIRFGNGEEGGALVEILLPAEDEGS